MFKLFAPLILLFVGCSIPAFTQVKDFERTEFKPRVCQVADEFCRQVNVRKAPRFDGDISIKPTSKIASLRDLENGNRGKPVLSVKVKIRNFSHETIRSNIRHEWYGGIAPSTDFMVTSKLKTADETQRMYAKAYQVGNLGKIEPKLVWGFRETRTFDIRLNWYGTGSEPMEPLIDSDKKGEYSIRFILFFEIEKRTFYVETKDFDLTVR